MAPPSIANCTASADQANSLLPNSRPNEKVKKPVQHCFPVAGYVPNLEQRRAMAATVDLINGQFDALIKRRADYSANVGTERGGAGHVTLNRPAVYSGCNSGIGCKTSRTPSLFTTNCRVIQGFPNNLAPGEMVSLLRGRQLRSAC